MRRTLVLVLAACGHPAPAPAAAPAAATTPAATPTSPSKIALPGAANDGVFLDYLAYDPIRHKVWVPAGGTGRVDVIDVATRAVTPIEGFATKEVERRGHKRTVGPTSATVGDGVVYVGDRADSSVCAVDASTLARGACLTLGQAPDGLQYVAATKEVWVTTPSDKSIRILDVAAPGQPTLKAKVELDGVPEGFAVDNTRGVFFTNLEDKDQTLVLDLKTHEVTKRWQPKCGEDGPRGLAFDEPSNLLVVACPDHVETFDANGAIVGSVAAGNGLDSIDYVPGKRLVFAAAAHAEQLTIASLGADGKLTAVAHVPTAKGARNAVASDDGTAFVADGPAGAILVVPPGAP